MRWWLGFSDRMRKFWLGLLAVYCLGAPLYIIYQAQEIRNAQIDTHALEHTIDQGLHKVTPALVKGQIVLLVQYANLVSQMTWIECATAEGAANCGPIPKLIKP